MIIICLLISFGCTQERNHTWFPPATMINLQDNQLNNGHERIIRSFLRITKGQRMTKTIYHFENNIYILEKNQTFKSFSNKDRNDY